MLVSPSFLNVVVLIVIRKHFDFTVQFSLVYSENWSGVNLMRENVVDVRRIVFYVFHN